MQLLKKLFQRSGRKTTNKFVVIYNVNHKSHRFTSNLRDKAESIFNLLAYSKVIRPAESHEINEGIVSLFINGILIRQISFTEPTGLEYFDEHKKSLMHLALTRTDESFNRAVLQYMESGTPLMDDLESNIWEDIIERR